MLVEAYQWSPAGNKPLLTAVDDAHRILGLPVQDDVGDGPGSATDNQRALNELEQAMKGLSR